MIKQVIKRNGSKEPFHPNKLNKWAEYASLTGGSWSLIAIETAKRLGDECTTDDIHKTMIKVCLDQEQIEYSRVASCLLSASIWKNMDREFGVTDESSFYFIFSSLLGRGLWCGKTMPEYDGRWEAWYEELKELPMEYWQVRQWCDKYSLKVDGAAIETPQIGALGIGLALHGNTKRAYRLARAIVKGKINLPTPALNGCRNGDFDSISCCVIKGGDTTDSIGVAEHIAYRMTAKKAGIGITFETRSKGDPVRGGTIEHLGKHGIYQTVDRAVKMFTQLSRGGSATMTYSVIDPEIMEMLLWKTQKVDIEVRIDKIDYSLAYNDAFLMAVVRDLDWHLFSLHGNEELVELFHTGTAKEYNDAVQKKIEQGMKTHVFKARDILKRFLTSRQETGRIYCINVSRANQHTPFLDTIYQSNLCQEICLPTKPYVDMADLYCKAKSVGETAFCALAAINAQHVSEEEYEEIADLALRTVDRMIDLCPALTKSMGESIRRRRSIGIGITGMAGFLYKQGLDYDGSDASMKEVSRLAERHYYYLLKSSQQLARESNSFVDGIDQNWLPIDTKRSSYEPEFDWEALRGRGRKHSVLVAHMPTESSAVFSDATNGLYPVRERVVYKGSRRGVVQYIAPPGDYMMAWQVDNNHLANYYGRVQDFSDQGISADYYIDFTKYPDGKVPMSVLMREWLHQARAGNKTMYYVNSNDANGGSVQDQLRNSLKAKAKEEEEAVAEEPSEDAECSSCVL